MKYDLDYKDVIKLKKKSKKLDDTFDYKSHRDKYSLFKYKFDFGHHYLFEIVDNKGNLSYPEMAIHSKFKSCDQTIEVEYIRYPRTWEYNTEYLFINKRGEKYYLDMFEHHSELYSHIEWYDTIYVYGVWKHKPSTKEMKEAYSKTIWFSKTEEEVIDSKIDFILDN